MRGGPQSFMDAFPARLKLLRPGLTAEDMAAVREVIRQMARDCEAAASGGEP